MTTVAAMQPYLLPYLGYFQLIHRADVFVLGDDYPWVRAGWINRNRVLDRGSPKTFTLSVTSAHVDTPIAERLVTDQYPRERRHLLARLRHAYARAPHLPEILPLVADWLPEDERRLFAIVDSTLRGVCDHLGIGTPVELSSSRPSEGLRGTDRVVRLVQDFGGTRFLNPPGGRAIYRRPDFLAGGVELAFLDPELPPYPQQPPGRTFVPALSILDVLMNVPRERARELVTLGAVTPAD